MATQSPLIASGPLADLGYVPEVSYGQVPVNPSLTVFRRRSTTLALTKDSYDSEEVRSDRMVSDSRHGVRRAGGDVVAEISPASHDPIWEALLGGIFARGKVVAIATNAVAIAITGIATITGTTWATAGFKIGDRIIIAGTGSPAYNGVSFTIVDIMSGTTALLAGPPGYVFTVAALAAGTITVRGKKALIGNIYRSFTMERAFTDIGKFIQYTGQRISSAAIALPPTGIATSTFNLLGKDALPVSNASIDGQAAVVILPATLGTLTFNGPNKTITCSLSNWGAAGIVVGDKIIIEDIPSTGSEQNNNLRTVIAVATTILTVAEAVQTSGAETVWKVTKVGLPAYTAAPSDSVLVAVSGELRVGASRLATVTACDMTIDNQYAGSEVVGANVIPAMLFGNQQMVSGSLTVLFDVDDGLTLYNRFDAEQEASVMIRLDSSDGSGFIQYFMPRCKFNSGTIGDAVAEGLPITMEFRALLPTDTDADASQIVFQTDYAGIVLPAAMQQGLEVTVHGVGTGEGFLDFSEGPAPADTNLMISVSVDNGPLQVFSVPIPAGTEADDVPNLLAVLVNPDPNVAVVGGSFAAEAEVLPELGAVITTLTAAFG